MKTLPVVALIGQTNAGKSALFNRLTRSRTAIVAFDEGTTRDPVMRELLTPTADFWLCDTAGLKSPDDEFEASIQDQIADAIDLASVLVMVVDSTKYPNHDDKKIARMALKSAKPVILALNKNDLRAALPESEFLQLGIKNIISVSANHGRGTKELVQHVANDLKSANLAIKKSKTISPDLKIALIGRPNVGKSSLFNTLANKQQALASSKAGTTRDINRVQIRYEGQSLEILDTAGVRKSGKQEVGVEKFSVARTLEAILEADVCCLLVDATEPRSSFDQSLAGQIIEAGCGLIIVVSKCDLVSKGFIGRSPRNVPEVGKPRGKNGSPVATGGDDSVSEETTQQILSDLSYDFKFAPYAPVVLTSSESGKNVTKILELALAIKSKRDQTHKTAELNKILLDAVNAHPPAATKGALPKLRYAVQTDNSPPWFVIYGAHLDHLHFSYKRYLENVWRQHLDFWGTPIKFSFRNSSSGRTKK
ncbi:ribosome biogenesis GTPase Der [Candidatus Saccharibacteria bacterium]|nr:ribosome biogenesis GTPase Der [Candidatus Saccharibacteria bacterium]